MVFNNIPAELRAYRQYCLWRYEETDKGKPTKVPYALTGYPAKVNDSSTWCSFAEAVEFATNNPDKVSGIGFILTPDDPFCFIDLDEPKNPDGTPLPEADFKARMEKQKLIHSEFNSYSELSPSGRGLHIIVKAKVESGRRRESVEVYSDLRFMTMTGQVFNDAPIAERQSLINDLWAQMGSGRDASLFYAGLERAALTNEQVLEMAASASNAEKFNDLFYAGNWQKYYQSQSEADFALVDILAFYSKNRMQVNNLFLSSALGQREKSRAPYRINYMLNRCFDNLLPPVDFEGLRNQVNEALEKAARTNAIADEVKRHTPIEIDEGKAYQNLPPPQEFPEDLNSIYVPPPGLLGMIAEYIYAQAPLPVPEIALAGAIGLLSGIVGKAYNVSATGLNQYTLVLAATGTGKESAAKGIGKLMSEVVKNVPSAGEFIGPSSISSPQALTKALGNNPSFVSIVGEFGLHLQQMTSTNPNPHMQGLKSMFLDLYNKSGDGDKLGQLIYSDKDKNTSVVFAPAFSLFGESAPEPFYESLNESMISGGMLPRFTIIEYKGDRVEMNKGAALAKPSAELIKSLSTLCANSLNLIQQKKVITVQFTDDARDKLERMEWDFANKIRGAMEVRRQLWNRAHLKVLKLAATVAVGLHPYQPVIDEAAVDWAKRIILADIANMQSRFETGEVGSNNDENKQVQLLTKLCKKFVTSPWLEVEKVVGSKFKAVHEARIVPYAYLQRNTSTAPAFKNDRMGATNALKRTLKVLQDRGDVQQMARAELMTKFGTGAECYALVTLAAFGL